MTVNKTESPQEVITKNYLLKSLILLKFGNPQVDNIVIMTRENHTI